MGATLHTAQASMELLQPEMHDLRKPRAVRKVPELFSDLAEAHCSLISFMCTVNSAYYCHFLDDVKLAVVPLNEALVGCYFNDQDVNLFVHNWLMTHPTSFFSDWIKKLPI